MQKKIIAVVIALLAVFLVAFVPQYVKSNRLANELRQSRNEAAGAELRDQVGLVYVQGNQKNYGLAAETAGRFFNRVGEVAKQTQDPNRRKALEDLLTLRDRVTADLAKGDAAVMGHLQELFVKTRQATQGSGQP